MRVAPPPLPLPLPLPLLLPTAAAALAAVACSEDPAAPGETLTIDTPAFTLSPGEEQQLCYYTTLENAEAVGVRRIASSMTPGSHHMIVFKNRGAAQPDGTLVECQTLSAMGARGLAEIPVWLYAAQDPEAELVMPQDVGISLAARQPVIVNMHYLNLSDEPLTASVHLELEAYKPSFPFTPAHTFVTFNTQIDVPAGAQGGAGGTCDVSPAAKFVLMSTHSHQYTTSARVRDGDQTVLETRDWAHATVGKWDAPYYSFASGKLDYRCEYTNPTAQPLRTGESAIANEMCMAVGVHFPAYGDTFCVNSFTITL